jgi:hypothetical protein
MVAGDERQLAAQNYHVTDGGRNVSISASAGDLRCLACGLRHSCRESIADGSPAVVVLSDQSFPTILPSNNGNCTVITRIEDGLLFEMEKVFLDVFAEFSGSNGSLALGSVAIVGSISYLGQRGLESYVNDLCRVVLSLV